MIILKISLYNSFEAVRVMLINPKGSNPGRELEPDRSG